MAYGKTPEEQKAYQAGWMAGRRSMWFRLNGPCVQCGSDKNLELDHINPEDKVTHNVWSFSKDKMEEELSKCQVLCNSCHKRKTAAYNRTLVLKDKEAIGAYWSNAHGKWRARFRHNGKELHLGYHNSQELAARAYDVVAKKYLGADAVLNFPDETQV